MTSFPNFQHFYYLAECQVMYINNLRKKLSNREPSHVSLQTELKLIFQDLTPLTALQATNVPSDICDYFDIKKVI
jgi:hypothetical protein